MTLSSNFSHCPRVDLNNLTFDSVCINMPVDIGPATMNYLVFESGLTFYFSDTLDVIQSIVQKWSNLGWKNKCELRTQILSKRSNAAIINTAAVTLSDLVMHNINSNNTITASQSYLYNCSNVNNINIPPSLEYEWVSNPLNNYFDNPQCWEVDNIAATCPPGPKDDVLFNDGGLNINVGTVIINPGSVAFCKNMYWSLDPSTAQDALINMGSLVVMNDFILDEGLTVLAAYNSNFTQPPFPLDIVAMDIPTIFFSSDTIANINTQNIPLPFDIEFKGRGVDAVFKINSRFDVQELVLSSGTITADKRKILASSLIVDNQGHFKRLDIDESVIVIKEPSELYSDTYFEHGSFDVMSDDAIIDCDDTRIVFKKEAIFNGGGNRYHKLQFKESGRLISFNSYTSDTIGTLNFTSGYEYWITPDQNLYISNTFAVMDTVGSGITKIKAAAMERVGDDYYPSVDFANIINLSPNDICLQNEHIYDILIATDSPSVAMNYCDTNNLHYNSWSGGSGWAHSPNACYSFLGGYAIDTSNGSRVFPGMASCFKFLDSTSQVMFDTIAINYLNTNGNFLFSNLTAGEYLIKIDPLDTNLVPHYFPDNQLWKMADTIYLQSDSFDFVVSLGPVHEPDTSNHCSIYGELKPDGNNAPQPLFNLTNAHLRGPVDIEDSLVIGLYSLDPNVYDIIQTVYSDTNGHFMFVNVPMGNYKIFPDIAGINVDTAHALSTISLSPTADTASIVFYVADDSIYPATLVYTSTYLEPELEIVLWPNPTQNTLNLRVPYAVEAIAFYDLMGRGISAPFSYEGRDVKVSIASLPKGIYVVSINGSRVLERIVRL